MPHASINAALRSTVVSRRGSSPGVSVSRGCRSNVTATLRASPLNRGLDGLAEHLLMAQVDAVEEPDGHDRGAVGQWERVETAPMSIDDEGYRRGRVPAAQPARMTCGRARGPSSS